MRVKSRYGNTNRNQYKTKKRFLTRAFFVLILFFCMQWIQGPLTASAATEHAHDISNGKLEISDSDTYNVTGTTDKYYIIVKKGNPTIKISNLHIDLCNEDDDGKSVESSAICISEGCNVTLIVDGINTLYGGNYTSIWTENWGYAGINIESGASLTIFGYEGDVLNAYGGGDYSGAKEGGGGIGSDANNGMGNLMIDGNMTINAYGAEKAAGIGSGSGEDVDGIIRIAGGTVNAYGGDQGAGIGSGREGYLNAVEISGGTVNAKGGQWAAGIGGGNAVAEGDGGDVGSIRITGGTITAEGGGDDKEGGAGIGGSDGGEVNSLRIEEEIEGENEKNLSIKAQGGKWGAGIGSAAEGVTSHNIPSIYIKLNGGTITATGGAQGAGIGGGNTSADKIEIYGNGTIYATGVDQSCAIGAGECEDGGDIIIKGDYGATDRSQYANDSARALNIYATTAGQSGAAAIGSADAAGGDISITNANVTLTDGNPSSTRTTSAGIGNAVNHQMLSHSLGDITIDNCKITDSSGRNGSSIGAGRDSDIGSITIKNSWFQGGNIGSSNNGNDFFRETCVDGITIENSIIDAKNTSDTQKAAIGSGSFASVKNITIKDSDVTATTKSGAGIGSGGYSSDTTGEALKWTGCECGNITITGSTVTAKGADGGAGIGGGWGTSVGDISIEGSDVTAESVPPRLEKQSGAGIGGGYAESAGTIEIKGSNVTATGGPYSAGIGSSGIDTSATFWWNTTCHTVRIKEGSTVTAAGGIEAAGIGTGCGAQFGNGSEIVVDDSTVTATGGAHGAGIGAGSNAWADIGGEACDIQLWGTSKIKATGGEGAAGVGGGYDGGAHNIYINLDETKYLGDGAGGASGSGGVGGADELKWQYYVIATGGEGAAGIGSGGVYQKKDGLTQIGHDVHKVDIGGGYVSATGGIDAGQGSGAGIGGGAHGGKLKEFVVTGGFIDAHAGSAGTSSRTANDIGGGGGDVKLEKDGEARITGGTVLGDLSSEFDIIIHGGSVRYITGDAVRLDEKTKVYRNQMQTGEQYLELQDMKTSLSDYGTNDVFADENGKVYPYLPVSGIDASTVSYTYGGKTRDYYGTTTASTDSGVNWLKMDGLLDFIPPETEPGVGGPFVLKLKDAAVTGDITFTVSGDSIEQVPDGTVTTAPGAQIKLLATDRTSYTVTAEADREQINSDMYWSITGTYSGTILKKTAKLQITEAPNKVYDGEEVTDPEVIVESNVSKDKVVYHYYDEAGNALDDDDKPVNAGKYTVQASLEGSRLYTDASSGKVPFTIEKKPVVIHVTAVENDDDASLTAELAGYVGTDDELKGIGLGSVTFVINDGEPQTVPVTVISSDGGTTRYTASVEFETVPAYSYTVKASLDGAANYTGIETEQTFKKNLVSRSIDIADRFTLTYGDSTGLELSGEIRLKGDKAENEGYEYSIVGGTDETIAVDSSTGSVTVQNAGLAIIKITLPESTTHSQAVAYTTVVVERADLTVTPYVFEKGDTQKTPVSKATYGQLNQLDYDLTYQGFVKPDDPDSFTKSHGTLEAAPLDETTGAGDYQLGVNRIPPPDGGVFFSRNYKIIVAEVSFTVEPALLYIAAEDQTGAYGVEPEYTCQFGLDDGTCGLMKWDLQENAVKKIGPQKSYASYKPGEYPGEIVIEPKTDSNYTFVADDDTSTVSAGDLTVTKGTILLDAAVSNKVYDGKRIVPAVTASAVTSKGIDEADLAAYSYRTTYYEIMDDGSRQMLLVAPKDAGEYLAVITAPITAKGREYYEESRADVLFNIRKARSNEPAPHVPDRKMQPGLTLADQWLPAGWIWADPTRSLEPGYVTAYAVYRPPGDEKNYYPEIRTIGFEVYVGSADDPGGGTNPSGSDDSDANGGSGVGTGDNSRPLLWAGVMLLAISLTLVLSRRRDSRKW